MTDFTLLVTENSYECFNTLSNNRQFLGWERTRTRTESNYAAVKLRFAIKCPPSNREDLDPTKQKCYEVTTSLIAWTQSKFLTFRIHCTQVAICLQYTQL
jgi:hypothetical protein